MLHRLPSPRRDRAADLELALDLAGIGSKLAFRRFSQGRLHVVEKADGTPVSDADMAAESEIRHRLEVVRPEDGILGEEFGAEGNQRERWLIDPIDGTANFMREDPNWAVMIALEVDRRIDVGVIDAPALGRRWWAARGLGAYTDGGRLRRIDRPLRLSEAALTRRARRRLDGLDPGHPLRLKLGALATAERDLVWAELLVAESDADIDLVLDARPWDLAAPKAIVTEAGCSFTDVTGTSRIDTGSALVATPDLHRQLLALMKDAPLPSLLKGRIDQRPFVVLG